MTLSRAVARPTGRLNAHLHPPPSLYMEQGFAPGHDLERLRKKYFRHLCMRHSWLRVLAVVTPGGWILAACRVVRPGGHERIPVDPPPDQPDLKQEKK